MHDGLETELVSSSEMIRIRATTRSTCASGTSSAAFSAVDSEAANFGLQPEWDGVICAQFDPAAGCFLDRG